MRGSAIGRRKASSTNLRDPAVQAWSKKFRRARDMMDGSDFGNRSIKSGGKSYRARSLHASKPEAQFAAEFLRRVGKLARVRKVGPRSYGVYEGPKRRS